MNARLRIALTAAVLAAGLLAQQAAGAGGISSRTNTSTIVNSTVSGNRATNLHDPATGEGGRSVALARGGEAATASPAVVLACPANTFCAKLTSRASATAAAG